MQISWLNHAGFAVHTSGGAVLLSDPWLVGPAFNDGWDLLAPSATTLGELEVSHLWFSHEHPDHFSPATLRQVPSDRRASITVLYQPTLDRRVIDFCAAQGFRTQELRPGQPTTLSAGLRVTLGLVPFYDSWLLQEADGVRLLNLNDCALQGRRELAGLRRRVGAPDVLLSQFSYANWVGNPDDREHRRAEAAQKLDTLALQTEVLAPGHVVPFASFVWFSHEENDYLNDEHVPVHRAADVVAGAGATPVVLYPGDTWIPGTPHDNGRALAAYAAQRDSLVDRPRRRSPSVGWDELLELAESYRARVLTSANGALATGLRRTGLLPRIVVRLWDLERTADFHVLEGLTDAGAAGEPPHVEMHSDSLAFVFKHDWGIDSLSVNGRFRATPANYRRMLRAFALGPLRNTGRRLSPGLLTDRALVRRAVDRLLLGRA